MTDKFYINVGIVAAESLSFTLNGQFSCNGVPVTGECKATYANGRILWNGLLYDNLLFHSSDSIGSSFDLYDVMIGVDFHWQRRETQRFEGDLRLTVIDDKIQAINIIDIERYLYSVISSEMCGDSPLELLKAHAIISRSWLIAQIHNSGHNTPAPKFDIHSDNEVNTWMDREDHTHFDVCADDHCQRYQGITRAGNPRVADAIEATRGIVLYDSCGNVADARFSKCCGGATELFENCWQPEPHEYLVALRDSVNSNDLPDLTVETNAREWILSSPAAFCNTVDPDVLSAVLNGYDRETPDFYRWKVKYDSRTLSDLIYRRSGIDFGRIRALNPIKRGPSGRIISLEIVGEKRTFTVGKELMIRRWLSESHLYSSAFVVETSGADYDGYPHSFTLHGAGWGHGVGLCQIGAAMMAAKGYDYTTILSHYFPNTILSQLKDDNTNRCNCNNT